MATSQSARGEDVAVDLPEAELWRSPPDSAAPASQHANGKGEASTPVTFTVLFHAGVIMLSHVQFVFPDKQRVRCHQSLV